MNVKEENPCEASSSRVREVSEGRMASRTGGLRIPPREDSRFIFMDREVRESGRESVRVEVRTWWEKSDVLASRAGIWSDRRFGHRARKADRPRRASSSFIRVTVTFRRDGKGPLGVLVATNRVVRSSVRCGQVGRRLSQMRLAFTSKNANAEELLTVQVFR